MKKPLTDGLPSQFVERLQLQFPEEADQLLPTFQQRPPVIRVNTLLVTPKKLLAQLKQQEIEAEPIDLLPSAFVAQSDRRTLTDLDEYKEGLFYIQSIASQLAVKALDPQPGETILDLCAAPGSKTTQIAIAMKQQGELIANDNNRQRMFRLLSNLEHQQVKDFVEVKNYSGQNYPRFYPEYFDRVLVDAPCSSESRFDRRYPKSINFWSRHKIKAFAKLGKRLLDAAIKCTKPGGTIVFSTCTFAPEENELTLAAVLKKHPEVEVEALDWKLKKLPILTAWNDKEIDPAVQNALRPHPSETQEGFFIAKLKKGKILSAPA